MLSRNDGYHFQTKTHKMPCDSFAVFYPPCDRVDAECCNALENGRGLKGEGPRFLNYYVDDAAIQDHPYWTVT